MVRMCGFVRGDQEEAGCVQASELTTEYTFTKKIDMEKKTRIVV